MDKVLEKFGIYDLVAVLLSGISILSISLFSLQTVYEDDRNVFDESVSQLFSSSESETLIFLVLSYFIGLVFQEIGSFVDKKLINKNNQLLKSVLSAEEQSNELMTSKEKEEICKYVKDKIGLKDSNESIIYNYCKFYLVEKKDTARIDKDQSIAGMSRSLSLYFCIFAVVSFFTFLFQPATEIWIATIFSSSLCFLFFYRYIRFTRMRYIYIFRTFYYQNQEAMQSFLKQKKLKYKAKRNNFRPIQQVNVTRDCT